MENAQEKKAIRSTFRRPRLLWYFRSLPRRVVCFRSSSSTCMALRESTPSQHFLLRFLVLASVGQGKHTTLTRFRSPLHSRFTANPVGIILGYMLPRTVVLNELILLGSVYINQKNAILSRTYTGKHNIQDQTG